MGSTTQSAGMRIESFRYRAKSDAASLSDWEDWSPEEFANTSTSNPREMAEGVLIHARDAHSPAEIEKRLAEEVRAAFENGRERGRQEGRQAEREAQTRSVAESEELRRRQAADVINEFAHQRERYFHEVEHEVVALALAVAARILRRESQMDPLLLTGAVRVAIGQLAASTKIRLRVPQTELELWSETIATMPIPGARPSVISGEGMHAGDCEIETELGTVDLGIRAQLGEIERGFFDRAGERRCDSVAPTTKERAL